MESDDGEAEIRSISLLIAGESKGEPRRILDERPLGRATSKIPRGLSSAARRSGWKSVAGASFADLDGDGDWDAVVPARLHIDLLLNDGTGAFAHDTTLNVTTSAVSEVRGVFPADMDNDGDADLVVVRKQSRHRHHLEQPPRSREGRIRLRVRYGDGLGRRLARACSPARGRKASNSLGLRRHGEQEAGVGGAHRGHALLSPFRRHADPR